MEREKNVRLGIETENDLFFLITIYYLLFLFLEPFHSHFSISNLNIKFKNLINTNN